MRNWVAVFRNGAYDTTWDSVQGVGSRRSWPSRSSKLVQDLPFDIMIEHVYLAFYG